MELMILCQIEVTDESNRKVAKGGDIQMETVLSWELKQKV